ncbi:sigma-70 family RNA polymerase sigma factor [Vagococcus salmoninarum]|uniref:sigma-70 family RNA polymerase sigma factor n=1 Tax=Vagococcus salmoninarum TaxID=2739 RepID=UPI0018800EA7|nr:sigma-70 family RNA polymerase sigma factor [Vagococcus salmoninarum]MBE9389460.1 sigma-70 family RNA polymerase sigma factor [Vagococcus salmoninarum]
MKKYKPAQALLTELYERYEQKVYRVAYRILNNVQQAEDVTQETFIQIYQKIEQVSSLDEEEQKRYILKVAKNKSIDNYRKNQTQIHFIEDYQQEVVSGVDNVASHVNELISDEQLLTLLKILPIAYQQVFIYRLYYGLNTKEVANILDISPDNVRKQYERAKKKIIQMNGGITSEAFAKTIG